MMLRLVVLGIFFTVCLAGDDDNSIGGKDYISCESCRPTKEQFPAEGEMACFKVKKTTKIVPGREITECKLVCKDDGFGGCNYEDVCTKTRVNVTIPDCELRPLPAKNISQRIEEFGTIYQINSPNYFGYRNYPNSIYCVWNIANEDLVTYRVVDQMLQNATTGCDEDDEDCKCPDYMKVVMGGNELKLCGSKRPVIANQMSSDGLHVKFCSDNDISSRGILVMAYRHKGTGNQSVDLTNVMVNKKKRQAPETCEDMEERMNEMSTEMGRMGCQYEYMMRMSQPGSDCPDDSTIMSLVNYHDYMITGFEQTMDMCDGMEVMSSRMPMMNNIESCAVDYLYRTRDCEFAKRVVNATNGELSDVARMIVGNNFPIRAPKWMDIPRKKCK